MTWPKRDARAIIMKVRTIGSEFSEVADEVIMTWIDIVAPLVSRRRFGKLYDMALALLVCHKMKMAGLGDSSMGSLPEAFHLSSYSEGSVSVSYSGTQSNGSQVDAEYAMTIYGMQYLTLRRSVIVPISIS